MPAREVSVREALVPLPPPLTRQSTASPRLRQHRESPPSAIARVTPYAAVPTASQSFVRPESAVSVRSSRVPSAVKASESRHYLANATARSQRLVDAMLTKVATYKTFQPLVEANEMYNENGLVQRKAAANSHLSSHHAAGRWDAVDHALTSAHDRQVRHTYDDHFLTTLAPYVDMQGGSTRLTGPNADSTWRANGGEQAQKGLAAADMDAAFLSRNSLDHADNTMGIDAGKMFLDAWRRDHPDADAAAVANQSEVWRVETAEAARKTRQRHLAQLKQELRTLVLRHHTSASRSTSPHTLSLDINGPAGYAAFPYTSAFATDRPQAPVAQRQSLSNSWGNRNSQDQRHIHEQRVLWEQFHTTEALLRQDASRENDEASGEPAFEKVVCDYEYDEDSRAWVQGGWRTHTHRHEDAALLIQRVFRKYTAKVLLQRRRAARQQVFVETLHAEDVARQQWEVAVRISATQSGSDAEAERALRALQFFSNRITAVAEVRRARRRRAAEEQQALETFAATTIQRVYRGHRSRQAVLYMRHPEVWEMKELERHSAAAVVIQKAWRAITTRRRLAQACKSACVIQRAYRSYQARCRARALRRLHRTEIAAETRRYAAQVIGRACLRYIQRRRWGHASSTSLEMAKGDKSDEGEKETVDVPLALCS